MVVWLSDILVSIENNMQILKLMVLVKKNINEQRNK